MAQAMKSKMPPELPRMIGAREIEAITGLSRTTIWRLVKSGKFPPPVELSKQKRAWPETELRKWNDEVQRGRDAANPD